MMTQRLKLFYGILGVVVGLCIGTFFKTFSTMETISQCELLSSASVQLKCKLLNSGHTFMFYAVPTSLL
jgi:hypothetical protein